MSRPWRLSSLNQGALYDKRESCQTLTARALCRGPLRSAWRLLYLRMESEYGA
jgi:hypothetical protein